MRFFRNPAFSTGTGGMILVFLAMYGVMFLITQYFQLVLGYSPLSAALRLLPMAPIMIVVSPDDAAARARRFGAHRTVAAGMLLPRPRPAAVQPGLGTAHALLVHRPVLHAARRAAWRWRCRR